MPEPALVSQPDSAPESQAVTVCRLLPPDWQVYRAIRLSMLQESPSAFGSTHDKAARFDERLWKERLTDNAVFLARVGQASAGSAMYSVHGVTDPGDGALGGMWVDPDFRGAGVGGVLVGAVIAHARTAGKRRVVLHVVTGNAPAARLYERAGFVPTGHTVPYPHDAEVLEVEMALMLDVP